MIEYINIIFLVLGMTNIILATEVSECTGIPKPEIVDVKDCIQEPCLLPRGQNVSMDVLLDIPYNSDVLWAKVKSIVWGMESTFDLPDPNVCNNILNGYCPVDQNESLWYRLNMPVLTIYPKISLKVKLTIEDDNHNPIYCFIVSCKVV